MSETRRRTARGLKVGDGFNVVRTFTEEDMLKFSKITRDYNPVHFDQRFSEVKKFKGRICHGLLVGSMLTEIGGQIGWLATVMNFRFKKPVYFGDTVECSMRIVDIDDHNRAKAQIVYRNQHGTRVLEADLEGILPGIKERQVLNQMLLEGDPTNKID